MFGRLMNSFYYGKSGKGDYRKEDLPKNRWQLFWEMLRIRLSGLCRINLMTCIAWIPTMVVVAMLLNAVLTASDLVRVKDETTNSSVMMLVYDAPVDEDGNPTGEATQVEARGILQMFALALIPCILITGPIQAGLAYVTRNWARDEHAFPWADFRDAVKDNWKQALGVSASTSVLPYVLLICYLFYGQMQQQSMFFLVPQMLTLVLGFVWWLGLVFMYPLMVSYKMKFGQVIKNGLMLAIARLPMTIGVRLATLIPTGIAFVVALLVPNGFLYAMMGLAGYYLILGNSMTRFVDASFTNAVFDKYINSRIEGVEINRGLAKEEDDDYTDEDEPEDDHPAAQQ